MHRFANFSFAHPYPDSFERYDTEQHTPDARRPSAGLHPEDKQWLKEDLKWFVLMNCKIDTYLKI